MYLSSNCTIFMSVVNLHKHLVFERFSNPNLEKDVLCLPYRGVHLRDSSGAERQDVEFGRDQTCCLPKRGVHFREVSG